MYDEGSIMVGKQPKRKERLGVNEYGRTALHNALVPLSGPVDLAAIAALLQQGVDPNAQDDNGFAPLHFAAQESLPEVARLLLDAGADPNIRDKFGNGPLFRAANTEAGLEVIKALLAAGADPFAENDYGVSPAELAFNSTVDDPTVASCIRKAADLYREMQK